MNESTKSLILLATLSLVFIDGSASGQAAGPQQDRESSRDGTNTELEAELDTARSQVASMERFQSDVLRTVYWSLGTVGTLAFALLAFSWFLNMRVVERERQALQQTLAALVRDELGEAKEALGASNKVDQERLNKEMSSLRKVMASDSKAAVSSLKSELSIQRYEIRNLELEQTRREGVAANELSALFRLAVAAHEANWEIQAAEALQGIERLLSKGVRFDASQLPELESFLGSLPEVHQSLRERIRRILIE